MDNINLNLYKIFYEVAKIGNISQTAELTYTSQSSISRSIKKLEEELQTQLFYRTLTGVELTEKGKILFSHVESIFQTLKLASTDLINMKNFEKGSISIGIPSQIASFYIFDSIEKFHKTHPNINVTIVSKTTSELLKLLKSHEVDFVIDTSPVVLKKEDFKVVPIARFNNCFICSKNINKSIIGSIKRLKDLEKYPLILPIPNTKNRRDLDDVFKKNDVIAKDVLNIHTSEMIIGAVKRGIGFGYVIKDIIESELKYGELELLTVEEQLPFTEICFVYDTKNLNEISKYFITNYLKLKL